MIIKNDVAKTPMLGWKTNFPRLCSILTGNLLETITSLRIGHPFGIPWQ